MATFAKKTFNVAAYLKSRPTYPKIVYDAIYDYHSTHGKLDHAVDLGCGPGFVAVEMAARFRKVTAVDPSLSMLEKGIQPSDPNLPRVEYKQGDAQDLQCVGEEGADLVVAAQAAHWFDYNLAWPELSRILRPGGTVAFVGYAEMLFPDNTALSNLITHHSSSSTALGPYWAQPGRRIVERKYVDIPFPIFVPPGSMQRAFAGEVFISDIDPGQSVGIHQTQAEEAGRQRDAQWDASSAVRLTEINGRPWLMRKTLSIASLEDYLRTWSSLHAYHEAHPGDLEKKGKGKDGDIVDRLIVRIQEGLTRDEKEGKAPGMKDEVEVAWPLVLMMIKKKA